LDFHFFFVLVSKKTVSPITRVACRTRKIGPTRNQNLIFWPLTKDAQLPALRQVVKKEEASVEMKQTASPRSPQIHLP